MASTRGFYVVGTTWGVGSTTTSAALITVLRQRGHRVAAFKPVEIGCSIAAEGGVIDGIPGGRLSPAAQRAYARLNELVGPPSITISATTGADSLEARDAERLAVALGQPSSWSTINRERFSALVSPALAARMAERPLDLMSLRDAAANARGDAELLVVDGAGGLMEPYGRDFLQRDLIALLRLPVVLVSTTERGAVARVLADLELLRQAHVLVAGVVLHRGERRPRPEEAATPLMIDEVAGDVVRGVLPRLEDDQVRDLEHLARRFATHVDVDALLARGD